MEIFKAERQHLQTLVELAMLLWPGHEKAELAADLLESLEREETAFFLTAEGSNALGFAQCQLRHDYVEGTHSSPVGYLEGIYVVPNSRRQGIARELLHACEEWAKEKGCREFASDCELSNTQSLQFHLGLGFAEANRIICFTKQLD